jgi:zinc transport system substrate-binding protein
MRTAAALMAVAALFVVGCADGNDGRGGDGSLDVVASLYPVAEAARRIGGDLVDVQDLTPAGVEPHDVELTASQVDAVEDADVLIYVGGDFQPAVAEVADRRDRGTLDLAPGVPDPHFWLDPQQMAAAADEIAVALAVAAPDNAQTFRDNAETYKAELTKLDSDFREGLQECDRREIVTAHEAFGHLTSRYGLTQLGIAGLSPETEPDAARLAELTDLIKAKGVTTVFFEELTSPDVAQALAREANVRTAVLSPIEGLSDEQRDEEATYLTLMRANLQALHEALGCR